MSLRRLSILYTVILLLCLTSCNAQYTGEAMLQKEYEYEDIEKLIEDIDDKQGYIEEYQTCKLLYNSTIFANNKEFNIYIYLYHIDQENDETIRGQVAAMLSYQDRMINKINLFNGSGIIGPEFHKYAKDEYFNIIHLKDGDLFSYSTPSQNDPNIIDTVYLTVNSFGELIYVERNFTDEEKEGITTYLYDRIPLPYSRFFNTTSCYKIDENDLIFYNNTSPVAKISFDFENCKLLCEDDRSKKFVYYD